MSTPDLPAETEAVVLAVLEARVKEHKAAARAGIERLYADGERRTIRVGDEKLGLVWRSDPDATWKVVDADALDVHLRQDPEHLEYVDEIVGADDQVLAVLAEHAHELLARVERVRLDVVQAAVAAAARGEKPAPGIARVKPRGTLTVRPDKGAGAAVERLVAAGVITWDGTPAALPAAAVPGSPAEHLAAAVEHRQGPRPSGGWGCLGCDWVQDKPHAEHVADMAAEAAAVQA